MGIMSGVNKSFGSYGSSAVYCPPTFASKPTSAGGRTNVNVNVGVNVGAGGWNAGNGGWGVTSGKGGHSVGALGGLSGGISSIIGAGAKTVGGWNTKGSEYAFQVGNGKDFLTGAGQGNFEFGMENKGGSIYGAGTPSGFEVGITGKNVNGFARGTGHTTSFTAGVNGLLAQAGTAAGKGKLPSYLDC